MNRQALELIKQEEMRIEDKYQRALIKVHDQSLDQSLFHQNLMRQQAKQDMDHDFNIKKA